MKESKPWPLWRAAIHGAVYAIVLSFPVVALTALLYRFPIPFQGGRSGPGAMLPSMLALVFYGTFGAGFVALGLVGAIGGAIIGRVFKHDERTARSGILWFVIVADILAALILANLAF